MTHATQILRHGGGCVPLRATNLFARLALYEDRRRLTLLQRARPDIPLDLADTLNAFRPLCRDLDNPTCASDMQALDNTEVEVVRTWLEASGSVRMA